MGAVRRHGTGCDAADIGMVAARGDIKQNLIVLREDRRYHGDVRQVCTAAIRGIEDKHVTGMHAGGELCYHALDTVAHGTQMHRHVWRIGNQLPVVIKQGAGEIQTLFYIDRMTGVFQDGAHLFGDGHKQVIEYFQAHRIDFRSQRHRRSQWHHAGKYQALGCSHSCLPTRFHHHGRVVLNDNGGAIDAIS